ncbi:hypothetical protein D1007_08268 [Hordeum vulgare]|nr:hypothetical protein D1007_08268 [Hordeum vulgare]
MCTTISFMRQGFQHPGAQQQPAHGWTTQGENNFTRPHRGLARFWPTCKRPADSIEPSLQINILQHKLAYLTQTHLTSAWSGDQVDGQLLSHFGRFPLILILMPRLHFAILSHDGGILGLCIPVLQRPQFLHLRTGWRYLCLVRGILCSFLALAHDAITFSSSSSSSFAFSSSSSSFQARWMIGV